MIVVGAKITCKPGKREEFVRLAQPCIAATRKEAGCRFYTLYASTENDVDLLYYELWESRAALDAHLQSAHMAEFAKAKQAADVQASQDVEIHETL